MCFLKALLTSWVEAPQKTGISQKQKSETKASYDIFIEATTDRKDNANINNNVIEERLENFPEIT